MEEEIRKDVMIIRYFRIMQEYLQKRYRQKGDMR
jgi:hypothetical protein